VPLDLAAPWEGQRIAVIDFESTGVDPATCMPVEIAAAVFDFAGERAAGRDPATPVLTWSKLLDPGVPIPPEATAVHGITDEMVQGKPTLERVLPELAEVIDGAVPCAYNAPYDKRILQRFTAHPDVPAFDPAISWIDVFVIVAKHDRYTPGSGRLKLEPTCARWDVHIEGAHRALADVLATGALLHRLLERGAVKPCPLGTLLHYTDEQRRERDADMRNFKKRKRAEDAGVWRVYAAAALHAHSPREAAERADEMLALERARFGGE
jgi:DNA polymerase-3 subunit epsilon